MRREHAVAKADQRDRLVRLGVLDAFRLFLVEQVAVRGRREHERVAVRCRRGRDMHAEDRPRARTVVHQDRLLETLRELRRDDASDDVRAAAGRPRHEQAHGFLGPRYGGHARCCGARERKTKNCNAADDGAHQAPLVVTATIWGRQLIVDNRPGSNGFLEAEAAHRAAADGYTFVQLDISNLTVHPHLYRKMPYDTVRDFDA